MNAREWTATFRSVLAWASLAGVLGALIVADTAGAKATNPETKTMTLTGETNLRKGPGTDSEIVKTIPKGAAVEVRNCRDGWCRVSWNGEDGYVIARNLHGVAAGKWLQTTVGAWQDYRNGPRPKIVKSGVAQDEHDADHSWILEIGTAGEWPLNGEHPNFGGTIAAEIEPIENWLELEFGLLTLATAGNTELSGDVLFKKPFRLSPTAEFMVGAGPSLSQTLNGPERGTSMSAEFALDFMFWPTKDVGWYLEPTWSVNPRTGQQSAAVSIGVLIGFSKP